MSVELELVQRLPFYPGFCIDGSQPQNGEGAVDTHIEILDQYHVYLSRRMGLVVGRLFGMVDSTEHRLTAELLVKADRRIAILEGELAELRPIADSIARFADRRAVEV